MRPSTRWLCTALLLPTLVAAQDATVRVVVRSDSLPVRDATVRVPAIGREVRSDREGVAMLRVAPGQYRLVVTRLGYAPDTLTLTLTAARDTTLFANLRDRRAELARVTVVSTTRDGRRVEDSPLRIEVIDEEELGEKLAMSPGDIAMLLNETGGLRVQTTNPSLGGANVRVQGLRGRYTLLLTDGLPLAGGGQAGGLGLLQIPPLDVGRVEVLKGTASALYGSAALGGVINLVSRRPGAAPERTLLVNATSRGGQDLTFFGSSPLGDAWGATVLAGVHRQDRRDLDGDRWTDMPGFERVVLRPRLSYDDGAGREAFLTVGVTREDRRGGTLPGGQVPSGGAFIESLGTRRADVGSLLRWTRGDGATHGRVVTLRAVLARQEHDQQLGTVPEEDVHRTGFAELSLRLPRVWGSVVAGAAWQEDAYRNVQRSDMDFRFQVPALFAQLDRDVGRALTLSASVRLDAHDTYGTLLSPRLGVLWRPWVDGALRDWTLRLSEGGGSFAPTPFTEETEVTGLAPLTPLVGLRAEAARSRSIDVGGPLTAGAATVELYATLFRTEVAHPLAVRELAGTTTDGASRLELFNAPAAMRSRGSELLLRVTRPLGAAEADDDDHDDGAHADHDDDHAEPWMLRVTASATWLNASECAPESPAPLCVRRAVPLTPGVAVGIVAAIEQHDRGRIGVEVYHTGRQALADNPFRDQSQPYVLVGLLVERVMETPWGAARLFLNFENLTDVRQTRTHPLLLPVRGPGGRWTTDAWTELVGRTVNGGVRWSW